jgi:uncharacterized protein (TIGR02246 family)
MRVLFASALIVVLTSCAGMPSGGSSTNAQAEVSQATRAWAAAYDSRNAARITSLYAPDAVLWGTVAKSIATTPTAVAEYFKNVGATPQNRVVLGEQNIRVYGDMAVNSGYYTFNNVLPDGKAFSAPARFSLVFRNMGGKWMIVDHHSSRLP